LKLILLTTTMLSEDKISMAHDTILSVLLKDVDVPELQGPEYMAALNVAGGVLCWVLEHDHNDSFQTNLDNILKCMKEAGYRAMPGEESAPVTKKVYPAMEYNRALRDIEAMVIDKILLSPSDSDQKVIYSKILDEIKKYHK
jgi:hypothetical protein